MTTLYDDMGTAMDIPRPPSRIVSLVPSLTEAIAATMPDALVGATDATPEAMEELSYYAP